MTNIPAGTYTSYPFAANTEYQGVPGKTIFVSSSPTLIQLPGVTLHGITFDTGGIRQDGFSDLLLENCIFSRCHVGVEKNGGTNLTIRNCLWDHCSFTTWISDMAGLLIEQNEINECGYGIKAFGNSTSNKNRVYRKNWIHDCPEDFMAFELQGYCDGWNVEQNLIERIRFGPQKVDNDHALLMSIPMALAKNGRVWRNAILGQRPKAAGDPGQWQNGHPLGIEAGGDNTTIEENLISGAGCGISTTDRDGTCSVLLKNNLITNVFQGYNQSSPTQKVMTSGTNDATTVLPWSVEDLRKLVGRAGASVPPPLPIPPTHSESDYQALLQTSQTQASRITAAAKALGY